MELQTVFGKGFVDELNEPVLTIGKDKWSKQTLASEIGVTNLVAARRLTVFCDALKVKSARELYDKTDPYTFAAQEGIGLTTMYVAWRVFEGLDLNPEHWYTKGQKGAVASFITYKHREYAANTRTQKAAQKRHKTVARLAKGNGNSQHGLK